MSDISIWDANMVNYTVSAVINYLPRRKIMWLSCISSLIIHIHTDTANGLLQLRMLPAGLDLQTSADVCFRV